MKLNYILLACIIFFTLSCTKRVNRSMLKKMLKSNDISQIIEAVNYIADTRDTSMVKDMLENSFDPRITHFAKHKGMSIYQLKMGAMRKLTGIVSPNKITYKPDSVNIDFYVEIAVKRGWGNITIPKYRK